MNNGKNVCVDYSYNRSRNSCAINSKLECDESYERHVYIADYGWFFNGVLDTEYDVSAKYCIAEEEWSVLWCYQDKDLYFAPRN
jgi:hypothetical protein